MNVDNIDQCLGNDDIFEDDSIKTKKKWPNLLNERSHMILEKFDGI